jgi:Flp pilus assembly pilin Flp
MAGDRRGQSVAEYGVLLAIVTAAVAGMTLYAKRSIQAAIKVAADQVGDQWEGVRAESPGGDVFETRMAVETTGEVKRGATWGGGYRKEIVDQRTVSHGALEGPGLEPNTSSYFLVEEEP